MNRFANKVALVTGAGQGIGFEIAKSLCEEGARVILNDIDGELAEAGTTRINNTIGSEKALPMAGDVGNMEDLSRIFSFIENQYGKLDILIANAGITHFGPFLDFQPEEFERVMRVNLMGSYFSTQLAARLMIKKQIKGRILLMSSVTGVQVHRNLSAYGISKAAIRMMARTLAVELGEYGITVNAIGPGATMTERTREELPDYEKGWKAVAPNQRIATVTDIAHAALFLVEDKALHITGETLMIDGGWTIYGPLPGERYDGIGG